MQAASIPGYIEVPERDVRRRRHERGNQRLVLGPFSQGAVAGGRDRESQHAEMEQPAPGAIKPPRGEARACLLRPGLQVGIEGPPVIRRAPFVQPPGLPPFRGIDADREEALAARGHEPIHAILERCVPTRMMGLREIGAGATATGIEQHQEGDRQRPPPWRPRRSLGVPMRTGTSIKRPPAGQFFPSLRGSRLLRSCIRPFRMRPPRGDPTAVLVTPAVLRVRCGAASAL
jgi:hypothetical protein